MKKLNKKKSRTRKKSGKNTVNNKSKNKEKVEENRELNFRPNFPMQKPRKPPKLSKPITLNFNMGSTKSKNIGFTYHIYNHPAFILIEIVTPVAISVALVYVLWMMYQNVLMVGIAVIFVALGIITIEPILLTQGAVQKKSNPESKNL